ncbi:immunity 52 family protein [Paraburkholderia sp. J67]|uniref:immunity 52 family protein n=1 Tax=Paraburkholderia sp. J67 TaxID=2805435 RepID=UPI002ABDDCFB|nr:immunity 52 family protein [Paraburkholderia sp. J67]
MSFDIKDIDIDIDLVFRLKSSTIPSPAEQCRELWAISRALGRNGLDVAKWGIGDVSDSGGIENSRAFTDLGPTDEAIYSVIETPDIGEQSFSVWNGIEGPGGAAFSISCSLKNLSVFELKSEGLEALYSLQSLSDVVKEAVNIWPAAVAQVGPYLYSQKKVFRDRPGVGWMLYLPYALTSAQVPEARALIPVTRDGNQQGTIIVSVADEVFDVSNRAHVKVANDIEIRLADQDLLPRFVDL